MTLDIQKPVDPQNSFRFFRGDNVVFNFIYKNGDEDFSTADAAKLRVYAKKVYARGVSPDEQPLFAEETTTVSTVSFNSSSTAGDAGNYLMAVILLDANNNLITAQGIYFDLIENGYAGIYQPGEDFRDEVLDALEQAQTAAQNAATSATNAANSADEAEASKTAAASSAGAAGQSETNAAQSESNAAGSASAAASSAASAAQSESNAESYKDAAEAAAQIAQSTDAGALMLSKMGAGQLWFNRGKLMVNSWANLPVSLPISICVEYDVDSWEGLGTGNQGLSFITASSVIWSDPVQLSGFTLRYNDSANRLEVILLNPGGASQSARGFSAYFNGGLSALPTGRHTIVFCTSGEIIAGAPSEYAMYVDGQAVGVSAVYFSSMISADLTSTGSLSICQKINYSTPNVGGVDIPIRLSRVRIFNFQMDAEGAPYSVADYVSGKLVPPALYDPAAEQRALLALEDYTISRNETTRLVKDVSGNSYDATVVESGGSGGTAWTGTVKGSRDSAVAAFVDEIKTQFTQSQG